jgi:hypothetical protein
MVGESSTRDKILDILFLGEVDAIRRGRDLKTKEKTMRVSVDKWAGSWSLGLKLASMTTEKCSNQGSRSLLEAVKRMTQPTNHAI